ncbi:MAG TPA: cation diffusion facilitator family transporter [Burkholderiales bacterium]
MAPAAHSHTQHRHQRSRFVLPLVLTAVFAVVEFGGGLWSGSLALLGDAGHMISDAVALGVAAVAASLARRPPGREHSYGWQRAEVIGALLNGVLMLAIVVTLVVEAVSRLLAPREVAAEAVIAIAVIGMAVNVACIALLGRGEPDLGARAALLHVSADLASSFAVLVTGVVIHFTGWFPVDPILSLAIGALILVSTQRVLRDALHVLMEGVPPAMELTAIGQALATVPGVTEVHDLHVWSITPGSIALSAHLEIADLQRWPVILTEASAMLQTRYGIGHVTLQPEVPGWRGAAVVRVWRGDSGPRSGLP